MDEKTMTMIVYRKGDLGSFEFIHCESDVILTFLKNFSEAPMHQCFTLATQKLESVTFCKNDVNYIKVLEA